MVHTHTYVCIGMCFCVYVQKSERGYWVAAITLRLITLRWDLSLNLEFMFLAMLAAGKPMSPSVFALHSTGITGLCKIIIPLLCGYEI